VIFGKCWRNILPQTLKHSFTSSSVKFRRLLRVIVLADDLVTIAISGLGSDYNSIIAALSTVCCHDTFSFSDLRAFLLSHEALLQNQATSHSIAFYAGRGGARYQNRSANPNSDSPCPFFYYG
jgi:hypothetical protein